MENASQYFKKKGKKTLHYPILMLRLKQRLLVSSNIWRGDTAYFGKGGSMENPPKGFEPNL